MADPREDIAAAVHEACSPREFEQLVATLYEETGYTAEMRPPGADEGVDVLATEGRREVVVQCKRYQAASKVGSGEVREAIGSAQAFGADEVHIVTTSLFTEPATESATKSNRGNFGVELVDGVDLVERLDEGNVTVAEDGDITGIVGVAGSGGSGAGTLTDELERHLKNEVEREVKDVQSELIQYIRDRIEEDYKDEIRAKGEQLAARIGERARDEDLSERARQARARASGVREGAAYRAGAAQDRASGAADAATERAGDATESAKSKAGDAKENAKEKAGDAAESAKEKTDDAKEKAKDVKERFF